MKRALIHDWLVGLGGGERTLEAIYELFPSPIYTLLCDESKLAQLSLKGAEIHSSFIQHLPAAKRFYRNYLPLFPLAIERFDLSEADLLISCSHAVAKGVIKHPHQKHLCYCFTPMRYAWDLQEQYMESLSGLKAAVARLTLHYMRKWDLKTPQGVDHFAAISHTVAERIKRIYGRESTVIYPPVNTHLFERAKVQEDYYFTCSRLVPYKRVDLIVEAFAQMPEKRLLVVGTGPDEKVIRSKATPNIELLGQQSDQVLRDLMAKAKAFVFAAEEDFGIVPVEAQASGVPVIAYGRGGNLETVSAGKTGIFFEEQTVGCLIDAIKRFEGLEFDPEVIQAHAQRFFKARFQQEFKAFVETYFR